MPPIITIIPPPKPSTEEEVRQNKKYLDEINDVLSEIAHNENKLPLYN